jgi:hypothetical protein
LEVVPPTRAAKRKNKEVTFLNVFSGKILARGSDFQLNYRVFKFDKVVEVYVPELDFQGCIFYAVYPR